MGDKTTFVIIPGDPGNHIKETKISRRLPEDNSLGKLKSNGWDIRRSVVTDAERKFPDIYAKNRFPKNLERDAIKNEFILNDNKHTKIKHELTEDGTGDPKRIHLEGEPINYISINKDSIFLGEMKNVIPITKEINIPKDIKIEPITYEVNIQNDKKIENITYDVNIQNDRKVEPITNTLFDNEPLNDNVGNNLKMIDIEKKTTQPIEIDPLFNNKSSNDNIGNNLESIEIKHKTKQTIEIEPLFENESLNDNIDNDLKTIDIQIKNKTIEDIKPLYNKIIPKKIDDLGQININPKSIKNINLGNIYGKH